MWSSPVSLLLRGPLRAHPLSNVLLSLQSPAVSATKATTARVHKLICLNGALQRMPAHTEAALTHAGCCLCAMTALIVPTNLRFYYYAHFVDEKPGVK